jgi:hypothetical protein
MCKAGMMALSVLTLVGCAGMITFNPKPGMSFEDWKRDAARSFRGIPELVGLKGNTSVYYLPASNNKNVFYWFENGQLSQVTQGQLPQVRLQIENINR